MDVNAPLIDGLGLDSLDVVEFVALIEQHYRIPVSDEEVAGLPDLAAIAGYIDARRGA